MKNKEIAHLLSRMGTLLEIHGENVFKVRAYFKAAENIESLGEDIEQINKDGRLKEIPGVGEAICAKIIEYLETGHVSAYDKLIKEVPEGLLELGKIPSVGPRKTKLFYEQLKITSAADLKKAIKQGKLNGMPGIKEKTVEKILKGLEVVEKGQQRMNLGVATRVADQFVSVLKKLPQIKQISAAGSLRRGCETVRDIDILIDATDPAKVMDAFVSLPDVKSINSHGETKSSILTQDNIQVDVRVVDSKSFGAALVYFTGSRAFNVKLRQIAINKAMKVNEYGIFSVKGGKEKWLAGKTEEDCFKALGVSYLPPELREELGEARWEKGEPVPELIEEKDICGELHVHSTWSDGQNTIAEMVQAAKARGYQYLAISDHSQRLKIAGGVSPADLRKKKKEIDELNAKIKNFRILFGTEVEIDSDGNLDYNEAILGGFDVVVASIHSRFQQDSKQITKRLLKVCQNKFVNIIGHPTGVHLGKREPYSFDLKEISKAARDHNVYLEINAFPERLDLNTANVYYAKSQGAQFVINTDAHHTDHLSFMKFGISIARRGWLTKEDVLNTRDVKDLLKALKK